MITVVQKPFNAEGQDLESGDVVDSTNWRNEGRLISCRFLRPATESEIEDFRVKPPASPLKRKTAKKRTVAARKTKAAAKLGSKTKAATKTAKASSAKSAKTTPPPTSTDGDDVNAGVTDI